MKVGPTVADFDPQLIMLVLTDEGIKAQNFVDNSTGF